MDAFLAGFIRTMLWLALAALMIEWFGALVAIPLWFLVRIVFLAAVTSEQRKQASPWG